MLLSSLYVYLWAPLRTNENAWNQLKVNIVVIIFLKKILECTNFPFTLFFWSSWSLFLSIIISDCKCPFWSTIFFSFSLFSCNSVSSSSCSSWRFARDCSALRLAECSMDVDVCSSCTRSLASVLSPSHERYDLWSCVSGFVGEQ